MTHTTTPVAEAPWVTAYIGLGSNLSNALGTPTEHIQRAVVAFAAHPHIRAVVASSLYQSVPMGPQDQPDFINAALRLETTLSPLTLLDYCQLLEQQAARVRERRWGERSLDVDILLYAEQQIDEPRLTVPHCGLHERNFVLLPLTELGAQALIDGKPLADHPLANDWQGIKRLATEV
ncbi:2-amino-4-hydroxy-6-hydroxymethyldihydropteridine diphosphokinase [Psychrobacter aestuarii]|uniref:2-amino-4-hydroxy-6-hydroxymethyldihydropteridine pyrophosphokinase n=1 Tax=Psychrobacter aestuarii TaxID=556327 RepID=A0ABN0W2B5_9GAMM|nr:2-amino-4-hydroxy-6-hydroxymethyldihydropteridine diphosphokinase [Psychrobacter aestuarii]